MEFQIRSRNHDLGAFLPTFQERVNTMLPSREAASAAPAIDNKEMEPMTPHYPTNEEIQETLAQVEMEAARQSQDLLDMHSGLNEQRVARLLGLLD